MLEKFTKEIDTFISTYEYAKNVKIKAETNDSKGLLGLSSELSNAFDHFIRAINLEKDSCKHDLIQGAISKAKGHLIRCCFDGTEMYILGVLERIDGIYKEFEPDDIIKVKSDFYSNYLPRMDKIKDILSESKNEKGEMVDEVTLEKLNILTEEIDEIKKELSYLEGSLISIKNKRLKSRKRENIKQIIIALLAASVGSIIALIFQ